MTRRRLPALLIVLGALIIIAAVTAAAIVRSSDTATLALPERPDQAVVVTMPGVLDAVDPTVTIRATAEDDEQVVLAIGRTAEVEAWLEDAEHLRVSGLSSWEELTTEIITAEEPGVTDEPATDEEAEDAETGGLPDPAGSDLWVAETVETGTAELTWTDAPGRWSLVAATDGTGPAPLVELEWGRQVSTPWLVPGIILGTGVLVVGVVMIVLRRLAEREQRRRDAAREEDRTDIGSIIVSVTDTDPGTGERLSRRQIREMERAMAQADRRRRGGPPPPIPPAAAAEPPEVAGAAEVAEQLPPSAEHDEVIGSAEPPAESPEGSDPPPAPSWRSVWGFAGTSMDSQTPLDQDSDGEEER